MNKQIYCIKINQKLLQDAKFDYWPYDRSYLVHKDNIHIAQHMFRYYFYLPLTSGMLTALNKIEVNNHRHITVARDDSQFKYVKGEVRGQFNWIEDPTEWTVIVPTHVKGRYKNNVAVASFIEYVTTKAINSDYHNRKIELPQISLHTPKREIEFFCAICTNLPNFYHGECGPGKQSCKRNIDTELPFDDHFRKALKRSVEEAGGE